MPVFQETRARESSLPLDRLRELTDLDDVRLQLQLLDAEEEAVDASLDGLLNNTAELDKSLDKLEVLG
jgi:prefoldin subunit 5